MDTPQFTVKYFHLYGRAFPVRVALHLAGANWKNELV